MDYLSDDDFGSLFSNEYKSQHSYDEHELPLKRLKPSNVDRITNLPDALIAHILSLMDIQTAVGTQILSKRWRYAWISSPGLIFSRRGFFRDAQLQVINNALILHKGPLLNLTLKGIKRTRSGIDPPISVWVQFAVAKKIEVLVLDVIDCENSIVLPQSFFVCDTLKKFSLRALKFDLGSSVSWKSLKKLTLDSVNNLCGDKILKIIWGSSVLESLNLMNCSGFNRVIVPFGSKLRNLVIHSCNQHRRYGDDENEWDKDYDELLLISGGPSITSLEISGEIGSKHCKLVNISSLVQVSLRFSTSTIFEDYESSEIQSMMMLLLTETSHVEKLSLGTWCIQVLSMCELENVRTTDLKCKILEIDSVYEKCLPGIARLLRSSPCLEKLTVCMKPCLSEQVMELFSDFNGENYWKSPERAAFKNPWQQLKVVQFIGSINKAEVTFMTELAEYVLDHAKVLEMLVLKPSEDVYQQCAILQHSNFFYVIKKLLSYSRCSRKAEVLLL